MPNKKIIFGGWGGKYTRAQLGDALHNHRGEFLELCRRITCDESAANNLLTLVEQHLGSSNSTNPTDLVLTENLLKSIKLNVQIERFGNSKDFSNKAQSKIEDEINLIQLLAEVHLLAVSQESREK